MFVLGMGAMASATQAVKRRPAESSAEVAVRDPSPRDFRQIEAQFARQTGCRFEQASDAGAAAKRWPIESAFDLEPRSAGSRRRRSWPGVFPGVFLLTAVAAMIGAAFILPDPIFEGLAISLIFGLASSTLLTVLVIPAIHVLLRHNHRALAPEAETADPRHRPPRGPTAAAPRSIPAASRALP